MSGDDVSLLRPATPDDHTAHPVARSDASTESNRPAQRRAGTPAGAPRAGGGERLARYIQSGAFTVSSCDYGTQDCREPARMAVSIDGLPARPICRRHTLVLVDAVAVYGDRMTLQIHRLDAGDLDDQQGVDQ